MARFYLDEDLPLGLKQELLAAGHDAVHARELFTGRRTDGSHLLAATNASRILVAYNRKDYLLLHDAWKRWARDWGISPEHGGILCLAQALPQELYRAIDVFLRTNLPIVNELYSYDPALSWVIEPYVP